MCGESSRYAIAQAGGVVTHPCVPSAQDTAGSDEARYHAKLGLISSLYRRGYPRQEILELFRFIDWVLALPEGLEDQLWVEAQKCEEEKQMRYVSSLERIGMRKGMEKGQVQFFTFLLRQRFGELPGWVTALLQRATPEEVEAWGIRVLSAGSLEEVFDSDSQQNRASECLPH